MQKSPVILEDNIIPFNPKSEYLSQRIHELEELVIDLSLENQKLKTKHECKILFCDFMLQWLEHHKSKVEPTTYDGYQLVVKRHIYPYFKEKNIYLATLESRDLQDYYDYKISQGLTANTIHKHHANIHKALDYACKSNLIEYNVSDKVELPKRLKYKASFYSANEIITLLNALKDSPIYPAVILAAILGLRRSEVLGLQWDSIDFTKDLITIKRKAVQFITRQDIEVSDKLKTVSSYRSLPIPPSLRSYLISLFDKHQKYYPCNNFVCIDEQGILQKPSYITDKFHQELKKHNLRIIRFHDLRHSCASILYALGYDLKAIQTWLGHSDSRGNPAAN